jgi:hypothetical protein
VTPIAHIAGIPVEETLPYAWPVFVVGLAAARQSLHRRRHRRAAAKEDGDPRRGREAGE